MWKNFKMVPGIGMRGNKNEEEESNDESIPELQRITFSPLTQKLMMSQVRRK